MINTLLQNLAENPVKRANNRRSFLRSSLVTGAAITSAAVLAERKSFAQSSQPLTDGDVAILRFLAGAELIEADLWLQYAELGGVSHETQSPYQLALQNLDPDGPQYVSSNAIDEQSHAEFLNAYLVSKGEEPVDLDQFRTLPSSTADGAQQIGRLTNLTQLKVDTSWYTRYRSTTNGDFGATFPQVLPQLFAGHFTAIPRSNADLTPRSHIQAIANTAAFHFGAIEQGGSSLYATLSQKVSSLEVLKITLSIGGDEIAHFVEWMDFSGNAVQPPIAPLTDPVTGLTFPNFNKKPNPLLQTNLIFPVPCDFISRNLPRCAVIRPTSPGQIDALGAANFLIGQGLFIGQPKAFTEALISLAKAADAATRES
jgi:hypothetical protein